MTRRDRLMATLRGEPVDRPPVNFYEIGGLRMDPNDPDPYNIYTDPSWQPLLQLAKEHTDLIAMKSPVRQQSHEAWDTTSSSKKSIRDEFFATELYEENNCRMTRTTLKVAGRIMTSLTRRDRDVDTLWTVEHLLKSEDDLKAFLQLPNEVFSEKIDINSLVVDEKKLGDKGILMVDTEDPICAAAMLFSMENFTTIALTEQKLFHQLLEKCARYIYIRTKKVAEQFPGRLWRIYGPEFASEPYLPPRLFDEYVVRYTGPMVKMIQEHGGYARIHCHGRLKNILDYIIKMDADAIDPIEPPPNGDVELDFVRKEYGKDLVLFGNIEISDIETIKPEKFKQIVRKSLENGMLGQGRGFVLMPSACPYGRKISDSTMRNYELMVELAHEFK
jgi:uroporphyrinogen-III decarboxylase